MALPDFPFGEQLFLWGIRMWVRAYNDHANIHSILHNGFKLAGVPDALGALDAMMDIFATAGRGARCPDLRTRCLDRCRPIAPVR